MRLAVLAAVLMLAGFLLVLFGLLWGVVLVWAIGMSCLGGALALAVRVIREE